MKTVEPARINDEGLLCPNCGELLKASLVEDDKLVCQHCVEYFDKNELLENGTKRKTEPDQYADYIEPNIEGDIEKPRDYETTSAKTRSDTIVVRPKPAIDQYGIESVNEIPYDANQNQTGKGVFSRLRFIAGLFLGLVAGIVLMFLLHEPIFHSSQEKTGEEINEIAIEQPASTDENTIDENTGPIEENIAVEEDELPSVRSVLTSLGYFDDTTITGRGGNVVDVPLKNSPCLIRVKHEDDGDFTMRVGEDDEKSVLCETTGDYLGVVSTLFEIPIPNSVAIETEDEWEITFIPMGNLLHGHDGKIELKNDDVFFIDERDASSAQFESDGTELRVRCITITGNGFHNEKEFVSEDGQKLDIPLDNGRVVFVVESDGHWTATWG